MTRPSPADYAGVQVRHDARLRLDLVKIGPKAMTDAERQARYRVARAADAPVIRTRRPADHRSRARRWQDAVAQLCELQAQYADWLEALPANQHDSALAEALQAICELDLSELESVAPPRGFGRD